MDENSKRLPPAIEADEQAYAYVHNQMTKAERAAFEAELALRADLRARVDAWQRARAVKRYLRMRVTAQGVRAELYLSEALDGYGELNLKAAEPQHRYAAGNSRRRDQEFYQTISQDSRLLLTLHRENAHWWRLTARYTPHGHWQLLGEQPVIVQTPHEICAVPEYLLCVLAHETDAHAPRRYAAWFIPDAHAPDCYVARLRLPDWRHKDAFPILRFGVVDADALRWLTPEERDASMQATVDDDAKRHWR
ncbi:MAG: hypothetical protein ACK4ME_01215 [Fimbriimonadales bacterium]